MAARTDKGISSRLPKWLTAACLSLALVACVARRPDYSNELAVYRQGFANAVAQCKADSQSPALDPIRDKVHIFDGTDNGPGFQYLSNQTFATDADRPVIAEWAKVRDRCSQQMLSAFTPPYHSTVAARNMIEAQASILRDESARIDLLTVALYQQRMTYGEFAAQRYAIQSDATRAMAEIKQAAVQADQVAAAARAQAEQQRFANTLTAFSAYMQAVNARAPQTVVVTGSMQIAH